MSQGTMFDDWAEAEKVQAQNDLATSKVDPIARPRLNGQCGRILELLRSQGSATNAELAAISLKYTARISDLRDRGHNVVCVYQDKKTGVCIYRLED